MRRHLWWVLGLVLVVGGLALALSSQAGPADFGWTAYTPLSEGSDWFMGWSDGSVVFMSRWQLVGWAVAAGGVVVLAAGTGFHLGRRRANVRERPQQPE